MRFKEREGIPRPARTPLQVLSFVLPDLSAQSVEFVRDFGRGVVREAVDFRPDLLESVGRGSFASDCIPDSDSSMDWGVRRTSRSASVSSRTRRTSS
ncbi:hypothetical protein [Halorussus caseinilyticus]|uniref:Uncharacterized protein n=1 Tax=Halorussus caseinilyticus TaxID=3034025 RepID=A0ABD5WLJ4_9EURY|nr:hypothetical protein [Halorussus sp. DT72]